VTLKVPCIGVVGQPGSTGGSNELTTYEPSILPPTASYLVIVIEPDAATRCRRLASLLPALHVDPSTAFVTRTAFPEHLADAAATGSARTFRKPATSRTSLRAFVAIKTDQAYPAAALETGAVSAVRARIGAIRGGARSFLLSRCLRGVRTFGGALGRRFPAATSPHHAEESRVQEPPNQRPAVARVNAILVRHGAETYISVRLLRTGAKTLRPPWISSEP
jgi:hypothetical protein